MIAIIDPGVGNLGSIRNMLRCIAATCFITSGSEDLAKADRIIFSGVGDFDGAMRNLRALGFEEPLRGSGH